MAGLHRIALTLMAALLTACGTGPHIIYGFMDAQGRWVVPPAYVDASPFAEGLAAVQKDGRWGYIDAHGQWMIEPRFELAMTFSEGLAAVETDGHWIFIAPTGQTVIAGPFDDAFPFHDGIAAVQLGEQWGFVDHSGRQVVAPQFEELGGAYVRELGSRYVPCFSEGLCAASKDSKWGYIDRKGAWAIEPRYAEAGPFREGLAGIKELGPSGPGKSGYIDRTGAVVIAARFESAIWFSGGRAIVLAAKSRAESSVRGAASDSERLVAVMIDSTGREIVEVGWEPLLGSFESVRDYLYVLAMDYLAEGLIPATRNDRWGFMNREGVWVIDPAFALVLPFSSGLAVAFPPEGTSANSLGGDHVGIIDTKGRWVIAPNLEEIGRVAAESISARIHGRWGILDLDQRWRVQPRYAEEGTFLPLPREAAPPGEGLQRVGVYANHAWIIVDPQGHSTKPREFAWLSYPPSAPAGPSSKLVAFLENGSWGLVDFQLHTVVPAEFDEQPVPDGEFFQVRREGQEGCIDSRGRVIVPIEFTEVGKCARVASLARVDHVWGLWDQRGGWRALPPGSPQIPPDSDVEDAICESVGFGILWARSGGRCVPLRDGMPLPGIVPVDEVVSRYMRGVTEDAGQWLSVIRRGDAWGVLDEQGRELLATRYSKVGEMFDGLIAVRAGDQWQVVDERERVIIPLQSNELAPFSREVAIFREGERYGLLHRSGRVILPPTYAGISPSSRSEATFQADFSPHDDPPHAALRPQMGVLDSQGRVRVPAEYAEIRPFSAHLWKASRLYRGWYLIDRATGQRLEVSARLADIPGGLYEGLAESKLRRGDGSVGTGYLTPDGQVAIEPQFDADGAGAFIRGAAIVSRDGKCGAIDRHGNPILALQYDHCSYLHDGRVLAALEAPWREVRSTPR
jgi:hypothetical protein